MAHDLTKTKGQARAAECHIRIEREGGREVERDREVGRERVLLLDSRQFEPEALAQPD